MLTLRQPSAHDGFVGLACVVGFAIYDILYNRSFVMLVRLDEIRQFGLCMPPAPGADARRPLQPNSDSALQGYEVLVRAVTGQMSVAIWADAFRFI